MNEALRKRAEERIKADEAATGKMLTPEEMHQTLHELRVHQIELEIQNEELRRAQAELETIRSKYFDLYDLAPIGYVTLSGKGLLLETNLTFATMLGEPRSSLTNQPFSRFIHKEDQDIYYRHHRQLAATGQPQGCELRLMKADATPIWVKIDAVPTAEAGRPTVYRAVISDISDRKHAEQLHLQIEGIIQHDLRTPASNAVNVATLLLDEDGMSDKQRQLLDMLNDAGRQMLDTLNRSLDLYRIETGQYREEPKAFDCILVVREIVQNLHKSKKHKSSTTHVLLDGVPPAPDAEFSCSGQVDLFRTSLSNLMKNALEATPKGGAVVVKLITGPDRRIEIRNQGVVPASIRERFFEKYITSGKPHGTGLGTYSAKRMIEAQGGTLEMSTSDALNGTIITIRMPECAPVADRGAYLECGDV